MDYPVTAPGTEPGLAVVWANYHQFGPDEVRLNPGVHSLALVWNNGGAGSVEINGRELVLTPSTFAFAPWGHDIVYRADGADPFLAAAVHMVPWPDPEEPVVLRAPPPHALRGDLPEWRSGQCHDDLKSVIHGRAEIDGRLFTLARLAVEHVQRGHPDGTTLRSLATLIVSELRAALREPVTTDAYGPPRLVRMQRFIMNHPDRRLSVAEVAAVGGMSESSARRMFRTHTRMPIGQWIIACRMATAKELLRTTNSVSEVARAVGFDDPAYFSRLFRRTQGIPPSEYARRQSLFFE